MILEQKKKFGAGTKKEIDGLIRRKTWKVVCGTEVREGSNILGGRFVLFSNQRWRNWTGKEVWKARFIVQGDKEFMKNSLAHNISVAKQQ